MPSSVFFTRRPRSVSPSISKRRLKNSVSGSSSRAARAMKSRLLAEMVRSGVAESKIGLKPRAE